MLELKAIEGRLSNLNLRVEKMGKEKTRPAADLKIEVDIPNSYLDQIHPGLLASLYRRPDEQGHQGDLTAADPAAMTTPRYPNAKPWASKEDWPGYFVNLWCGAFNIQNADLAQGTLKGITIEARNGGTASLSFTFSGHPDAEQVGSLYEMLGRDVTVDLNPPTLGDLERLRKEAKAPKVEPDDDDTGADDGQGAELPSDAAIGRAFPDAVDARGDNPPSARRARRTAAGATAH